jgi:hypothetical protein
MQAQRTADLRKGRRLLSRSDQLTHRLSGRRGARGPRSQGAAAWPWTGSTPSPRRSGSENPNHATNQPAKSSSPTARNRASRSTTSVTPPANLNNNNTTATSTDLPGRAEASTSRGAAATARGALRRGGPVRREDLAQRGCGRIPMVRRRLASSGESRP